MRRATPRRRRQGRPPDAGGGDAERRILAAALTAFATHGYDATSIREIVAAAGVTAPTLYHHCRTKRDLFARLLEATCAGPLAAWEQVAPTAADWRTLLTRFAAESFAFARADARLESELVRVSPVGAAHGQVHAARPRAAGGAGYRRRGSRRPLPPRP